MTQKRTQPTAGKPDRQRGGFLIGMIVGLLLGLAIALGVAVYVTKVPVPFVNKVPQRTAEQDQAEAEKNRNWDPNAPLASKVPPPKPSGKQASGVIQSNEADATSTTARPDEKPTDNTAAPDKEPPKAANRASGPASPAPSVNGKPVAAASSTVAAVATPSAAASKAAAISEPTGYAVQAGAFAKREDADKQRAALGMLGYESKVVERDQGGKTIFRVRIGPFEKKEQAEDMRTKLDEAGISSAVMPATR
jgi:cell division protein FtsN